MADMGTLYVVATPIGNLGDLTPRAADTLRDCDLIAAEDTRHTRKLLTAYGIHGKQLVAYHEHNEAGRAQELARRLLEGCKVALVADAGTPAISDPGTRIVQAARMAGIAVIAIPGPSALTAALSVSSLPSVPFVFGGFLPAKRQARRRDLGDYCQERRTVVFFETPHRIRETLADMLDLFGPDRPLEIARELTKQFETVLSGSIQDLAEQLDVDPDQRRGEMVLLLGGATLIAPPDRLAETLRILLEELPIKQAATLAARLTGAHRNLAYREALAMKTALSREDGA